MKSSRVVLATALAALLAVAGFTVSTRSPDDGDVRVSADLVPPDTTLPAERDATRVAGAGDASVRTGAREIGTTSSTVSASATDPVGPGDGAATRDAGSDVPAEGSDVAAEEGVSPDPEPPAPREGGVLDAEDMSGDRTVVEDSDADGGRYVRTTDGVAMPLSDTVVPGNYELITRVK